MKRVMHIAWREFSVTVFTWSFMLSILMLPILGVLAGLLTPLMHGSIDEMFEGDFTGTVLVVDPDVHAAMRVEAEFDERYHELTFTAFEDLTLALDRLTDSDLVVAVVAPAQQPMSKTRSGQVLYISAQIKLFNQRDLRWLVAAAEGRIRLETAGFDPKQVRALAKHHNPEVVPVGADEAPGDTTEKEHRQREAVAMVIPLLGLTLTWLGVFISAQYLLQNTMEERSSKVMEVLLSAVSPMHLMSGKIIGLGLVGFVLTGVYGGTIGVGLMFAAMSDLIRWSSLFLFCLYYLMAYLVMGSMFAAIGSAVTELREAQSLMTPGVLLMTVPFLLIVPMMSEPNGSMAVWMSYVPLLTPFVMSFRVLSTDPVPWLQVITTLIWGYMWAVACVWASAKVFRVGVLMQGKAPTITELARWVFED